MSESGGAAGGVAGGRATGSREVPPGHPRLPAFRLHLSRGADAVSLQPARLLPRERKVL
jgi:hypothetical protein